MSSPRLRASLPTWALELDPSSALTNGLVAHWLPSLRLENLAPAAPRTLSPTGAPVMAPSSLGSAFAFNGTSQYLGASDAGLPTGDKTVAGWFRFTGTYVNGTDYCILAYGDASIGSLVFLYMGQCDTSGAATGIQARAGLTQYGAGIGGSGPRVDDGAWHYALAVNTGTIWTMYVDGVQTDAGSMTTNTSLAGTVEVGNSTIGSYYFSGQILTASVWNRVLSPPEIKSLFDRGPYAMLRQASRRAFYLPGSTVFLLARSGAVSRGRAPVSPSAGITAHTQADGRGRTAASPSALLAARTQADGRGRAPVSPAAPLVAHTQADAVGRAAPTPSAPLTARTEGTPSGRATTSLAAPLASKTQAGARGNAAASGVSQLSGSARTQGASAGRATGSAATSLSGRTAGAASGKAATSPSTPLSGKTQAGSRASATAGGVSQLSASARTAGLATGRAASSLGTTVTGRARGNGGAKAALSPSTVASARTQAGGRGAALAGGVSLLFGSASTTGAAAGRAALSPTIVLAGKSAAQARALVGLSAASPLSAAGATRGRAAGGAAIAVSAALSASTISRGAMRSGLAAGTALVAVARSRAFGHAINGEQPPLFFNLGRVATIPADSRFVILRPFP